MNTQKIQISESKNGENLGYILFRYGEMLTIGDSAYIKKYTGPSMICIK